MSESRISDALRIRVRARAGDRCGYCRSPQHLVFGPLEIEHITPRARGGSDDEPNLWLACRMCNNFKGVQTDAMDPELGRRTRLFNPRRRRWTSHFAWNGVGTQIIGYTPCGRATVIALQLNNMLAILVRQQWVAAGWHPPADA